LFLKSFKVSTALLVSLTLDSVSLIFFSFFLIFSLVSFLSFSTSLTFFSTSLKSFSSFFLPFLNSLFSLEPESILEKTNTIQNKATIPPEIHNQIFLSFSIIFNLFFCS